jgi:hypothetical protein
MQALRGHLPDHTSLLLPLPTWLIVGSVPDGVAEAPGTERDRRLVLPFALEVVKA